MAAKIRARSSPRKGDKRTIVTVPVSRRRAVAASGEERQECQMNKATKDRTMPDQIMSVLEFKSLGGGEVAYIKILTSAQARRARMLSIRLF